MYSIAVVAVENAAYGYDKEYSYLVPADLEQAIRPGCRVGVPFGRGNRKRTAIVLERGEVDDRESLKPVDSLLDPEPLLNDEGMHLLRYVREQTFCTWFDAAKLLIPAGLGMTYRTMCSLGKGEPIQPTARQAEILSYLREKRKPVELEELCGRLNITAKGREFTSLVEQGAVLVTQSSKQRIRDDKVCMVRLCEDVAYGSLTPKQKQVAAFLEEMETASLKEACYYTGVTRAVVDRMRSRGVVEYFETVRMRSPYEEAPVDMEPQPELTEKQREAFERLRELAREDKPAPALLYGVTGSGKTQVFLKLMEHVTNQGKTAMVLVPEISLTAQAVEGFRQRFGGRVAVLHSGLSLGERTDEWRRIKSGEADIVVGTRSAVFAPLERIGLIVVDEEQEHTYHSDKSPRFHARDIALRRSGYHGALLLLCSATPSVESYYQAKEGRYHLIQLEERYHQGRLPDVYVVDMADPANASGSPSLSGMLLEELRYNLEHGEQSILLLNRRGYSTVVKCSSCGAVADCPNCSVAMTYHSANDSLNCHYCGHVRGKAETCDYCGSSLIRYSGAGTQKLEEELKALYPDARVLRVDMDTTMTKFSHQKLFSAFAAGEYDIMVGTQMVAKGLNFPRVTLVGVLCADQSLYAGDFRSFERSFSLLTQVVGRCGRGEGPGRAFVQTYSPENPIIQLAAKQDYPAFFAQEIRSRKLHLYPPFCVMAGIGFSGECLAEVQKWSEEFLHRFTQLARRDYPQLPIRVLGPAPAEILRAAGKYRYKLILKCRNSPETRQLIRRLLQWYYSQCKTVSVSVDMYCDRL